MTIGVRSSTHRIAGLATLPSRIGRFWRPSAAGVSGVDIHGHPCRPHQPTRAGWKRSAPLPTAAGSTFRIGLRTTRIPGSGSDSRWTPGTWQQVPRNIVHRFLKLRVPVDNNLSSQAGYSGAGHERDGKKECAVSLDRVSRVFRRMGPGTRTAEIRGSEPAGSGARIPVLPITGWRFAADPGGWNENRSICRQSVRMHIKRT